MNEKTKEMVMSALMASLICVVTMMIKIPSPLKGYLNLGDGVVLIAGWILSPVYSFLAAGIGSALADMISGYMIYVPVTFVIKGMMAVAAFEIFKFLHRRFKSMVARIISGIAAEIVMIAGYFLFEGVLYGFIPAMANIVVNSMQGIAGLIIGTILMKIFEKKRIPM